jgi:hypothetical protein
VLDDGRDVKDPEPLARQDARADAAADPVADDLDEDGLRRDSFEQARGRRLMAGLDLERRDSASPTIT